MTKVFLHPSLRRQIDLARAGVFACKPGGAVSLPDVRRVNCRGCGGIDTFEVAP